MRNPNHNRIISYIAIVFEIFIAGISIVLFGTERLNIMFYLGTTIAFSGIVYGIFKVRCPYCKKRLHLKGIVHDKYCQYCGKEI